MAGSAIDASKGGKGAQSDNVLIRFGRDPDRGRVCTIFPLDTPAKNSLKGFYRYDYTKEAWESKLPTSVRSSLLNTTRRALILDGGLYDGVGKGVGSGGKVWRIKVCAAVSTIARTQVGTFPAGAPAKYTYYNIPVGNWVTAWIFAHSVFPVLRTQVNQYDGSSPLQLGQVVAYISPFGRSYTYNQLNVLYKLQTPPTKESAIDKTV
jgi:hypothetical protein